VTPVARSSETTGMMSVIRSTAGAVGAQVCALLLASSQVNYPAGGALYATRHAYQLTFGFIVLASVAALIVAVALPRRGKPLREPLADMPAGVARMDSQAAGP